MLKKIKKIGSRLSWSLTGNIVYAFSQWLIITIIARFGSTNDLGIYSLGLAVTAPIVLFFNFQQGTILATDSKNEFKFNQYFGSRIINLTISFVVILPISFIYFDNKKAFIVILLMGLVKYFESLSDICMGLFQKRERIDLIGKSQLHRGLLTVLVVGSIFILFRDIIVAVLGLLILMIIRFFSYDLKKVSTFTNVIPSFDNSWLKLIKLSFPLGIVALINSLNSNIPRYLLEYFSSLGDVGIYSALTYILLASGMVIRPISLMVAPKLASAYNNSKIKGIYRINSRLILFSISIALMFILIVFFHGEILLKLIYGEEYIQYNNILIIISFTIFFTILTTFFNINLVAARAYKAQPILNFLVTIITLVMGSYLIKNYGLTGAAYSLLISTGVQTLFSFSLMLYAIRKLSK